MSLLDCFCASRTRVESLRPEKQSETSIHQYLDAGVLLTLPLAFSLRCLPLSLEEQGHSGSTRPVVCAHLQPSVLFQDAHSCHFEANRLMSQPFPGPLRLLEPVR
uniref:STE20-related kinase adaptor beta n=1 Tax=Mus musculus TaxID=10090 RepID=M0QW98_MOUSE